MRKEFLTNEDITLAIKNYYFSICEIESIRVTPTFNTHFYYFDLIVAHHGKHSKVRKAVDEESLKELFMKALEFYHGYFIRHLNFYIHDLDVSYQVVYSRSNNFSRKRRKR